jgi:hypothetical protein
LCPGGGWRLGCLPFSLLLIAAKRREILNFEEVAIFQLLFREAYKAFILNEINNCFIEVLLMNSHPKARSGIHLLVMAGICS